MRTIPFLFILSLFVSACAPREFQGNNPREADVQIENNLVTITIPKTSASFYLLKVDDDSVPYGEITFRYDRSEKNYFIRTDVDEWQPIPPGKDSIVMGLVTIEIRETEVMVTYPSGSWAFP